LRKLGKRRRKPSKRRYNRRLEFGLKHVRGGDTLEEAGAKIGRTAKQVRDYIVGTGVATERKGKLVFGKDRRYRSMPMYSGSGIVVVTADFETAQRIGAHRSAVGHFLREGDTSVLAPFEGQSIKDVFGNRHLFATRPNVLLALDASDIEPIEAIYSID
jgi:hypothetical protein